MKAVFFVFFLLNSAFGFGQNAEFFIENDTYKFPRTLAGDTLYHAFNITNKGSDTLVIQNYKVACSCTKINYPSKIAPGERGVFQLSFDTTGKYGLQDRTIIFMTNTKRGMEKLRFKVMVESKS
jgi:hypothetical protein